MFWWIGLIVISPLWGLISTQLFLQSWLAFATLCINAIGFLRGRVSRSNLALGMGVSLVQVVVFSLLLYFGDWLLTSVLHFGWSRGENISYWIFAVIGLVHMVPQIPGRVAMHWRCAMIPGALEANMRKGI